MGILYNRFTPGFTLLPYSDQSKIITYATYENFDANSSTWGEGTAPIQRSGTWSKDQDASGYISFHTSYNWILNTSALGNKFTVYEVLKHINYPQDPDPAYNLIISRGSQSERLFSPDQTSDGQNVVYNYVCRTSVNTFDVSCQLPTLDQLHVTAAAYEYSPTNRKCRLQALCNSDFGGFPFSSTNYAEIEGIQLAGNSITTRCYKFIAVVAEDEANLFIGSNSVVRYNMAVLKAYFGIEYDSPI
jgi:hypothetical protein